MSLDETNGGVSLSESNGGGATGDQGAPKRSKKKAKNTKLEPQVTFDENGQPIYPADMSETDKVIYQSMESTKRMVALCEESKGAAINTLVNLDDQGEQLDNIEEGLDTLHADMKEAESALTDLNKCCGLFTLPWDKVTSHQEEQDKKIWSKKSQDGPVVGSQPGGVPLGSAGGCMMSGNYISRVVDDEREDAMEDNMGQVAGIVTNLKHMALDMGSELDNQNRQLDRIKDKANSNQQRVSDANKRATKILGK